MVRQSLLSLTDIAEIDYLGPEFCDHSLKKIVSMFYLLQYEPGYTGIVKTLFSGAVTGYHKSWLTMSAKINWDDYDLVYLEYSRYGFIARLAKNKLKKLVIRVHNVEKDYYNRITGKRSLSNNLRLLIKRMLITRQESICLSSADSIICLTKADKKRLAELYPTKLEQKELAVIPVALEQPQPLKVSQPLLIDGEEDNPYLLITGSLWFGPNAAGAAWFIKNVWQRLLAENHWISIKYKLVIAGSRPGKGIQVLSSCHNNIELIDSPLDMKPYFEKASIYLAPIFSGAGMKVKVAEALSYGLPVIGTNHALTGYRIIDRKNGYRADNADGFIDSLEYYMGLSTEAKNLIRIKAYQLFQDDHSIEVSKKLFQQIIDNT